MAKRLRAFREQRGKPGLITFAIDTELLGHWWSEGPIWLEAVLRLAGERGVRLLTLPEALARHDPEERPLRESTWGEGKDLRTWDSPEVADLAWAARRLELRLLAAIDGGALARQTAERGARELLALQASDWAFLDRRGQAGDYPYQRSSGHAQALLEAIHSREPPDPRMRNLAPDLSPSPCWSPEKVPAAVTRVLILSWEYPPLIEGGLARHVRKLSEALVELGVDVHVLTRGEESPPTRRRRASPSHRVREPDPANSTSASSWPGWSG